MRIGINPTSIGVSAAWWLDTVRDAEAAGFTGAWIWDHFMSRGRRTDPVLECWSMLAAASRETSRIRLGSFVTNVMNRHPAVLARITATVSELSGGRVDLGIGAGGNPAEHDAYGLAFPEAAVRGVHLEEAVTVIRQLFAGGPADRDGPLYPLHEAYAFPAPDPAPRIVVSGSSPAGARRAARIGDAWTCGADDLERLRPVFEEAAADAGRDPASIPIVLEVPAADAVADLDGLAGRWAERSIDELVVGFVRPAQIGPLLDAASRSTVLAQAGSSEVR
jgi:alkanesulfonate monooxygenase SsuD/methylene tetrahydromethanopterin reductase-like flavin-dependent oxidoreductase (luciferase family)